MTLIKKALRDGKVIWNLETNIAFYQKASGEMIIAFLPKSVGDMENLKKSMEMMYINGFKILAIDNSNMTEYSLKPMLDTIILK